MKDVPLITEETLETIEHRIEKATEGMWYPDSALITVGNIDILRSMVATCRKYLQEHAPKKKAK